MLPLNERLDGIVKLLKESDERLSCDERYSGTGYVAFKPESLLFAIRDLLSIKPCGISLDMGCGNGGFMLFAAAAGYDSYGIEIHPLLIEETMKNYSIALERKLIDPCVKFKLACGNFYLLSEKESFFEFMELHDENHSSMPWCDADAYIELGLSLQDVDIIYAWSWPIQSRFLYNFLEREANKNAIFVLPGYMRYTQGEHLNEYLKVPNHLVLSKQNSLGEVFIGHRAG